MVVCYHIARKATSNKLIHTYSGQKLHIYSYKFRTKTTYFYPIYTQVEYIYSCRASFPVCCSIWRCDGVMVVVAMGMTIVEHWGGQARSEPVAGAPLMA